MSYVPSVHAARHLARALFRFFQGYFVAVGQERDIDVVDQFLARERVHAPHDWPFQQRDLVHHHRAVRLNAEAHLRDGDRVRVRGEFLAHDLGPVFPDQRVLEVLAQLGVRDHLADDRVQALEGLPLLRRLPLRQGALHASATVPPRAQRPPSPPGARLW